MTVPVKMSTAASSAPEEHSKANGVVDKKLVAGSGSGYIKPTPENAATYRPTHDGLLRVVIQGKQGEKQEEGEEGDSFSSFLVAEKDIPANSVITPLSVGHGLTPGPKAYSSVQHGPDEHDHFELNSDLLFINHSCYPNVAFDVSEPASDSGYPSTWHLKSLARPIRAGEPLTFFYPSTEWDMSQGFACACGEGRCLGWIRGAKDLPRDVLERQEWINPHVWELKKRQQQQQQEEQER